MTVERGIARATVGLTIGIGIARVLGWFRFVVIAWAFGVAGSLDAFFAAFRIPDLMYQLVAAGALSAALIPTITSLLAAGERERAWRVVSAVMTLLVVVLAALAVLMAVTTPLLAPLIAPGFDAERSAQLVDLTRIMLLSPVFLTLGAVATSVLNAERRFMAPVIAPIAYNLVIIVAAVTLGLAFGIAGLAAGVVIAAAVHLGVQLPHLRAMRFRFTPSLSLRDPETRRTLLLMGPRALALGVIQVQLVAAVAIASGAGPGAVAAFSIAFAFFQVPLGVAITPISVATLPSLSWQAATDRAGVAPIALRVLRFSAFLMFPAAALLFVTAPLVSSLSLGFGSASAAGIGMAGTVLAVLAFALPGEGATSILAGTFFALRDTRTPVIVTIAAVATSVTLAVLASPSLGVAAPALGIVVASLLEPIVLFALLRRRLPGLDAMRLARSVAGFLAGAVLAGAAAWLALRALGAESGGAAVPVALAALLLACAAAGLAYLASSWALRLDEVGVLWRSFRRLVARLRTAGG